jgi:hypothetical protein
MLYGAIFAAAILHVVEEYFFPGGFTGVMKEFQPEFAPFITVPFAVIINGLFLAVCLAAALFHGRLPWLGLAVAALVGINGLMHAGAAIRRKRYAPGVMTGVLLYLPLCVLALRNSAAAGLLSLGNSVGAAAIAVGLQLIPIAYLGLERSTRRPWS